MENYQFFTLIGMLAAGFGWLIRQVAKLDKRMNDLETRVTVIETILSMMGMPLKQKNKE